MTHIGINCNKIYLFITKSELLRIEFFWEIIRELEKTEWDDILNSDDVIFSYETFVNKLTDIKQIVLLSPVRSTTNDIINHG